MKKTTQNFLATLVLAAAGAHAADLQFPAPTGPAHVGTAMFSLKRGDRPLQVQLWYPTAQSSGKVALYIPDHATVESMKKDEYYGQKPEVIDAMGRLETHSFLNAAPAKSPAKFPVLLMEPGAGTIRSNYTMWAEQMASAGYLVVGIDPAPMSDAEAADTPESNAMVNTNWAQDGIFAIDAVLKGAAGAPKWTQARADATRIGMFGHSLGGAASLEACLTDPRIKACANLDGAPFGVSQKGIGKPGMIVREQPDYSPEERAKKGWVGPEWEKKAQEGAKIYSNVFVDARQPGYLVQIKGTGHFSFTDGPYLMPDTISRFGGKIMPAARVREIVIAYLEAFFGKYLNGKESPLLDGPPAQFPEVTFRKFGG